MKNPQTYEATLNSAGTDDQIVNACREIVARCGYQVGNCEIRERSHTDVTIWIDIYDHPRLDPLQDDSIMSWGGIKLELTGLAT